MTGPQGPAQAELDPANRVKIFDTTLRDGGQTPGVSFTPEDKLVIAHELEALGVDIIEAGFPASTKETLDHEQRAANANEILAMVQIAHELDSTTIAGLSRTDPADIENAYTAVEESADKGGARVHTFIGTSPTHMKDKLKMTPDEVIEAAGTAVRHARTLTADVEFSPEDASRSDFDFMMRVVLEAVDNGATTINIPDTVGYAMPEEYARRISRVKALIDRSFGEGLVTVSVHTHDDLGNATANAITGVMAGARQVEAAVNQIGERAGNCSLEEAAGQIGLRGDYFGGLYTGIDLSRLPQASKVVSQRSGIVVPPNKALVGRNAFRHKAGIHQKGMEENTETYEWIEAQRVGRQANETEIGDLSGGAGVRTKLKHMGIQPQSKETVGSLIARAKELIATRGHGIGDNEIETWVLGEVEDEYKYVHADLSSKEGAKGRTEDSAEITLEIDGEELTESATTDSGVIDASKEAIAKITGFSGDIEDLKPFALHSGSDSEAGALITVRQNGYQVIAYAEGNSIDRASVQAYVKAINLIRRIEQRKKVDS
ncbi:MAG TPA: 2-isopropylmalate synthase [Candidatus Saccharimonadales bacterium]|nr:2-isopropylmalate synthase [Candidatus Saccharimonadales bacterium]